MGRSAPCHYIHVGSDTGPLDESIVVCEYLGVVAGCEGRDGAAIGVDVVGCLESEEGWEFVACVLGEGNFGCNVLLSTLAE